MSDDGHPGQNEINRYKAQANTPVFAEPKPKDLSEWQPIETAPEGEYVLVCNPNVGRMPVVAEKIEGTWFQPLLYGNRLVPFPIYWMRWPKVPRVEAR